MLLPSRISPERCNWRSICMFCMAAPRSTTTKQFDCWIIMRSTGTVEPSL